MSSAVIIANNTLLHTRKLMSEWIVNVLTTEKAIVVCDLVEVLATAVVIIACNYVSVSDQHMCTA